MKKVFYLLFFACLQYPLFSQALDFNTLFKTAVDMFNKGNYGGAKVRFAIAERKALQEKNYSGEDQCREYRDISDECVQDIKNGERTFNLGEFEIAKKYFDRVAQLNPKDPGNIDRASKCRNENDYLVAKKQADAFYLNKDWNQAYSLYLVCLDSSKRDLNSYKRYYTEVQRKNQDCLKQMNILNPDSIKVKLKAARDKLIKKFGKKKEEPKTPEVKPEDKNPADKKPEEKDKHEALLRKRLEELFYSETRINSDFDTIKNKVKNNYYSVILT